MVMSSLRIFVFILHLIIYSKIKFFITVLFCMVGFISFYFHTMVVALMILAFKLFKVIFIQKYYITKDLKYISSKIFFIALISLLSRPNAEARSSKSPTIPRWD